MTETNNYRNMV